MIQITVAPTLSGFGPPWMAYSEQLGGLDYSCENGEDFTNCGSPIGEGKTIAEAIEDFCEQTDTESFKWN